MRVLIAEQDHPLYAQLLRDAAPDLEVLTSGDSAELSRLAADCPVWLGQPDLLATLLRQGHHPQWLQSTWVGITPLLYLQNARIDRARKLLESSDLPLKVVATQCGFGSDRHLRKVFCERIGMTPAQYRAQFGGS